eukprot:Opistho-2@32374
MSQLCIITGASRGFGRSFATLYASSVPSCCFILLSRDSDGLNETKRRVCDAANSAIEVATIQADLGDIDSLPSRLDAVFAKDSLFYSQSWSLITLVNNAATTGNLSAHVKDYSDVAEIRNYMDTNVTSVVALTSRFVRECRARSPCTIVNVSSLMAVMPFAGWGLYCTGKAARDMLHSVVSVEEKQHAVKVLNYAPGPLDTDMQRLARETLVDEEQRRAFEAMHNEGRLLTADESASVLVRLLVEGSFESGKHIDYYDVQK